jgi:hypothetical protein
MGLLLQSNLSQFGNQTLYGDLFISLRGVEHRKFGVKDMGEIGDESVSLLLGNDRNEICHRLNSAVEIKSESGVTVESAFGKVCSLGAKSDTNVTFFGSLSMNQNSISDLKDPEQLQDAVTKKYVDRFLKHDVDYGFVKNNVGLIPVNISTASKAGFTATASSESNSAYKAFAINNASEWTVGEGVTSNFWIQIELPDIIQVHKFALRNKRSSGGSDIKNWVFQGSINGSLFVDLFTAENTPLGNEVRFYSLDINVGNPSGYKIYRLFVKSSEGNKPGISYFQLFSLDPIVSLNI